LAKNTLTEYFVPSYMSRMPSPPALLGEYSPSGPAHPSMVWPERASTVQPGGMPASSAALRTKGLNDDPGWRPDPPPPGTSGLTLVLVHSISPSSATPAHSPSSSHDPYPYGPRAIVRTAPEPGSTVTMPPMGSRATSSWGSSS